MSIRIQTVVIISLFSYKSNLIIILSILNMDSNTIIEYAKLFEIKDFIGVFAIDEL